ncbi:hypothetical protein ACFPOE_17655 [Caenimonas terrae]|uniref:Lipoprotein n=1 Tax=Caenimonas terrae TaxID=696074 RepID=A0ABW0NH56_9BURK
MRVELRLLLPLCLALSGCTSLLPRGSSEAPSTFESFAQAQAAAERIVPFQTRSSQLKELGFDPQEGRNVTLIPYPDIVGRLAPHPGVPFDSLDPGIRKCIVAQSECRAFLFHFERQDRRREDGFWLDFFNIRRITNVQGWWFEALVVVSKDEVLFRNFAGQAHTDRVERQLNPLGPLQPAGESAGTLLLR